MHQEPTHEITNQSEDRRKFLKNLSVMGGAAATSAIAMKGLEAKDAAAQSEPGVPAWPWAYAELDPTLTQEKGYLAYSEGGCCYGAFKATVGHLAETYGAPFTNIPVDMMRYGGGGVASWGTLCGALNGSCAAIQLVCNAATATKLINELMAWYCSTELPTYIPAGKDPTITTVSNSPLCHASVSKWCMVAGKGVTSPERKERCGRLTGEVAKKAVELLNAEFKSQFVAEHSPGASVTECMQCHGSTAFNNVLGKMECVSCHEPHSAVENWLKR